MDLPIKFDHFSQGQKIVLLVCVAVIFLGLGIGLSLRQPAPAPPSSQLGKLLPTAAPTPVPSLLKLDPSAQTLKVGETLSVTLSLSSGDEEIDAVDAIVNFDPAVFRVEKIVPGKIFTLYPIKESDNKSGQVQLSAAAEIKESKITSFRGSGELGTIVFRALKAASSTEVSWDTNSIAAFNGQNILDLEKSEGGNYEVLPK